MSYKTDELTNVLPDAYAVDDAESLIYKLLDAFGAELMTADEKVKRLLKSHWVNYAEGPALDGLAAVFGVRRRLLYDGVTPESDDAFRTRLKAVVPTFAGGGTREAVLGAVRSAFGLPFDLRDLNLPEKYDALRTDIESLIVPKSSPPQRRG
jgi:phage-related baseplate assembly protein